MTRQATQAMLHGLVAAQDLVAAACGTLNALYFLHYWLLRRSTPRRRVGAAALAVANTALVVESLFFTDIPKNQYHGGVAPTYEGSSAWVTDKILFFSPLR